MEGGKVSAGKFNNQSDNYDDRMLGQLMETEGSESPVNSGWKSPDAQLETMMFWEKKPSWFPQEKWDQLQEYKNTGGVSNKVVDNADPSLVNNVLQAQKFDHLNTSFQNLEDLSSAERTKITALLSDQLHGKLTYDDVMRMSENPELLKIEMEKNSIRQESLVNEMNDIAADQQTLEENPEYQKLEKQATVVNNRLQELIDGGINKNSSPAEIEEYNSLLKEYKGIEQQYASQGFKEIRENQAAQIAAWQKKKKPLTWG